MNDEGRDRVEGMIWGQFLGDAMCLGTHWIYNLEDLKTFYPDLKGFEQPRAGHYHAGKKPGELTQYGEAALVLLELPFAGLSDEPPFAAVSIRAESRDLIRAALLRWILCFAAALSAALATVRSVSRAWSNSPASIAVSTFRTWPLSSDLAARLRSRLRRFCLCRFLALAECGMPVTTLSKYGGD